MSATILVFNVGSSSIKLALYAVEPEQCLLRGLVERIGSARIAFSCRGPRASSFEGLMPAPELDHDGAVRWLLEAIDARLDDLELVAAGHRVVHGGREFAEPVRIDGHVVERIEALIPLAPNHQPHNLSAIHAIAALRPGLPQVACFDTAFHRTQPEVAQWFALPRRYAEDGVLRYGFHGLSYEYLAGELARHVPARADGRVVLAHLGHGASLCAMRERRSVATTMGFTALDGLMMGRRCGEIDPGVLIHLQRERGMSVDEIEDLLYNRSGLLGVSEQSDDLRELEASDDPRAEQAMEMFAYRAARSIGSLAAALGGLDVVVFSAGIGEHSSAMRRRICERTAWLGIEIDAGANAADATCISTSASRVDVLVLPTDEEIVIARATRTIVEPRAH